MTIEAKRKDRESFNNLLRRFNRKVQQSGVLPNFKQKQHFEKEISKRERREDALRRKFTKEIRRKKKMGLIK